MADGTNLTDGYSDTTIAFLEDVFSQAVEDALVKGSDRTQKVLDFKEPKELETLLDLAISKTGCTQDSIVQLCRQTLQHSVNTAHPRFWNQFHGGPDPYALAAGCMVDTLNNSQHTFESAPVFRLVEKQVIRELGQLVGYTENETDGIFAPGGSICNMLGYHVARYKRNPSVKHEGMYDMRRLVMFSSEEAHYSTSKGAMFLGVGMESVVTVKTDKWHRMSLEDLERKIIETKNKGGDPYLVHATLGTTVIGAFDPVDDLADLCEKYNLWLHADLCWGAPALFTSELKPLTRGLHRANSVALSFQKMPGVTMQCCAVLIKDETKKLLENSIGVDGQDYASYYPGNAVQDGRKPDAFKLWLMWKAVGHDGMARRVERNLRMAELLMEKIKGRKGFLPVLPQFEFLAVCFWYVPPSLRNQLNNKTDDWWNKMSQVAPKIKARMARKGSMLVTHIALASKGYVNFFRMVHVNALTEDPDIDFLLDEIERLGRDL